MSGGLGAGAPQPGAAPNSRDVTSLLTGAARGVYGLERSLRPFLWPPLPIALTHTTVRFPVGQEPVFADGAASASADSQPW